MHALEGAERTWTQAHIPSHGMKNKWVTRRERERERGAGQQISSYSTYKNL